MSNTSTIGDEQVGYEQVGAGDDDLTPSIVGVSGIPTSVAFGSGGIIGLAAQFIIGTAGIPTSVAFGSGGEIDLSITGVSGVPTSVVFGTTGAIFNGTPTVLVYIAGVDRTAYVEPNIERHMQASALSNCILNLNNVAQNGTYRSDFTIAKFEEVLIYVGTYRFFDGVVDTVEETVYPGTPRLRRLRLNCFGYAAMMDRRFVAKRYEVYDGAIADVIVANLISVYLSDLGITYGGSEGLGSAGSPFFPAFTFNWVSVSDAMKYICDKLNASWFVDQWKQLKIRGTGVAGEAAPFTLSESNAKFETLKVTKGGSYWNKVIVRNSQDLGSIWTDTFTGDGSTRFFAPTTAALTSKPVIRVNGVAQVVTDPGVYTAPWDWYWLAFGVQQNPANAVLTGGDTLTVLYPSDISFVVTRQDDTEIATFGLVEHLEELKDITSPTDMGLIADGLLAKGIEDITTIEAQTDLIGLEPGQTLPVSTNAFTGNVLIEQVDSIQIGSGSDATYGAVFFRHTVRGSDANLQRRDAGGHFFQQLLDIANQPRDRITLPIGFTLAETIPGITNPGLTTGAPAATVRRIDKVGPLFARTCTLYFKSTATTLTTTRISVDVLQNGTSIFPSGTANKMVFPAGATVAQIQFVFASDPMQFNTGDIITLNVLEADSKAMDGVIELTLIG